MHRRIREYAKAVIRDEVTDLAATASLKREIIALRPEIASLATETTSGPLKGAAARSTIVALVAELHAVRALAALPMAADPVIRERLTSVLDRNNDEPSSISPVGHVIDSAQNLTDAAAAPLAWALSELLRRDEEVRQNLVALKSGMRPLRAWRAPLYQSNRIALGNGIRASAQFAIASALLVLAAWPATSVPLSVVALVIGLGAVTPNPRGFTTIALSGRSCRRIRIPDSRWRLRLPATGNWARSIRRRSGALDQRSESGTRVSGPDQSDFLHGNLRAEQSTDL
jgi:hypothetical protein